MGLAMTPTHAILHVAHTLNGFPPFRHFPRVQDNPAAARQLYCCMGTEYLCGKSINTTFTEYSVWVRLGVEDSRLLLLGVDTYIGTGTVPNRGS